MGINSSTGLTSFKEIWGVSYSATTKTNTYNHPMKEVKQQKKQESILMFCLDNFHYIFHSIIA